MKGKVLTFDIASNQDVILGTDGKRYSFSNNDWKDKTSFPVKDLAVDFQVSGKIAQDIYLLPENPIEKYKSTSSSSSGILLMLGGFILIIFGVFKPTTVRTDSFSEVYNTGLMNEQRNLIEIGGIAFISGTILYAASKK